MGLSNIEDILQAGLDGETLPTPESRIAELLKEWIEQGGNVDDIFVAGANITLTKNPDGTITIAASGEVSSEDTVARADIAAIKDGETLDSFGDVETALGDKADTSTTYTKTDVDTALSGKQDALSAEQLSAVNSGIDSTKVAQITTNKNNIAKNTAELVDLVDSGAKSLVNFSSISPFAIRSSYTTITDGYTIKGNANATFPYLAFTFTNFKAGDYVLKVTVSEFTGSDAAIFVKKGSYSTGTIIGYQTVTQTGDISLPFTLDTDSAEMGLTIYPNQAATEAQQSISVSKLMICSKAAWDVSQKYVPYRPTYEETVEQVATNKNNIADIKDGTSINSFGDVETALGGKQNAIDSSHKLSADLVDDTNATNKFATAEELGQIQTNKNNISKDEAALVALVDGGAKNIFDPTVVPQTATRNGVTITRTENGIHVSGTVTATGDTAIANNIGLVIPSDGYHFYAKTTAPNLVIWMEYKVNGSSVYSPLTRDVLNSGYVLNYIYFKSLPGGAPFDVDVDLMLCTAESYAISPTFVPYRPSYQELYEMVKALQANQ